MRSLTALLLFAASCGAPYSHSKTPTTPAAAKPATAVAPKPAAAPSEADALAKTHAYFDALDQSDQAAMTPLLAPQFSAIWGRRMFDVNRLSKILDRGKASGYPKILSRTWDDERVRVAGSTVVVTGFTTTKEVTHEGGEPLDNETFVALVWIVDDSGWHLLNQESEDAGVEGERAYWNTFFRQPYGINFAPNQLLVDSVKGVKPGKALDIAMGQGRNSIFLAKQGWKVTGVDISNEGIARAQEEAKRQGLKIDTIVADVDKWDWGTNQWDLIVLSYAGGRDKVDQIRKALKPGGLVVIEFFRADSTKDIGIGGFEAGELPKLFKDGFKVLRYDEVEDVSDWGQRKTWLVRFVAQKL